MLGWVQDVSHVQTDTLQFLRYVKMEDEYKWDRFNQLFPFEISVIS